MLGSGTVPTVKTIGGEKKPAQYFGYEVQEDRYGVAAPWCNTQNGPCDFRVRVSAETLKRYPWADASKAITPAPEYVYRGHWHIDKDGTITINPPILGIPYPRFKLDFPKLESWRNGDLGDRYFWLASELIHYYSYSGNPMVFGSVKVYSNCIFDYGNRKLANGLSGSR